MALILVVCCRFGEARHPGPSRDDLGSFCIGACNPTGLNAKHGLVAQLSEPSIFGFSETHLSQAGVVRFRQDVKFFGSCKQVLAGAPAPLRPHSKVVGSHTGVALTSTFPCRNAPHSWPAGLVSSVFVSPLWVLVGVTYGHPTDPVATKALLEEMTARVVLEGHGPRVLIGDFNLQEPDLPHVEVWKQHGFIEVQALQQMHFGCPPSFVSHEFHSLFCRAIVDHSFFPDHAVLYGEFRCPSQPSPRLLWQAPSHRNRRQMAALSLCEGILGCRDRPCDMCNGSGSCEGSCPLSRVWFVQTLVRELWRTDLSCGGPSWTQLGSRPPSANGGPVGQSCWLVTGYGAPCSLP